ncbi:hypothetical protein BOO69_18130 [Sulfitobacter alexandrii]|uniref:Sulfotransferase family protein n=1 Tax=Sulfitobacter alexandrii TaxID=1917485 RepID=A0A1J0WLR9_9RHOB|nr:hypothetical protein BOO69_18130 [Sulfitobacter alexandrii]
MTTKTGKTATRKKTARKPAENASASRKKPAAKRTAVVVLGMHRSGTSATAGVLNLLGCDTPANQMKPTKDNEKGYFESESVYKLHNDLLSSAGSSWDDWLPINPGWFKSSRVEEFHDRALELVKNEFGDSRLFVLKDPRICRLVPFWEDVLKESGAATRYVLTHRNPLEVAASLERRDNMNTGNAMLIWLRHVLDAEASTRGKSRCFMNFTSLLQNWAGAMTKVQQTLDLSLPRFSVGVYAEVESFLDRNLKHHDQPPEATLDNPMLSEWVRDTYAILEKWAATGEVRTDHKKLDATRAALTSAATTFAPVIQDSRKTAQTLKARETDVNALQEERSKLESRLKDAITARDNLAENRDAIRSERDALRNDLTSVEAERDSVRQTLTKTMSEKASLDGSLTAVEAERNKLKESLSNEVRTLQQERADFEKRYADLAAERDEHARKRESLVAENASLRESRNETAAARDALRAQVADAKARLEAVEEAKRSLEQERDAHAEERASFQQEKESLQKKLSRLQTAFDQSVKEQDRVSSQLVTLTDTHDRVLRKRDELAAERNRLMKDRDDLSGQRDRLAEERDVVVSERDSLKKSADDLSREKREIQTRLETLAAEQEVDRATLRTVQDELAQARSALAQRTHEAEQTHRELQALKAEQPDRDRRFVEMKTALSRKETALEQEAARISQLQRSVSDKSNQIAILETSVKTQQREITELTRILMENEQSTKAEIAELRSRGAYAEAAWESMRESTSWRITAPLRWVVRRIRN